MNKKTKELNKINNEMDKKINKENQEIFTDITLYIRGKSISEYNQEVVRHDISEMIISSQERGEKIEDVIGIDYKEFCDNIIENIEPKTTKEKIIDFFNILCSSLSILLFIKIFISKKTIELIGDIINKNKTDFNLAFSIGDTGIIIFIIITAIVFVTIVLKNPFKARKKRKTSNAILFVLGGISGAILYLVTKLGRKIIIFNINIFIVFLFAIILFMIHKILDRI